MKTKILGKKHINCDSYDILTIQKFHNLLEIKASTREKQEYYRNENVLDKIRGLTEEELVAYLINYYLDNNDLNDINYFKDLKCKSIDDRLLNFKSYMSDFSKEFIKKMYQFVICKYVNDRELFIKESDFKNINIKLKEASSKYSIDENDDSKLDLVIATNKEKIESYEETFLREFLLKILNNSKSNIEIQNFRWNEFNMSLPCFNIRAGDVFINLDKDNEDLRRIVMDIIKLHENEKERRR